MQERYSIRHIGYAYFWGMGTVVAGINRGMEREAVAFAICISITLIIIGILKK